MVVYPAYFERRWLVAKAKDLYLQFKELTTNYNASNSTTLVEGKVDTGLTIRGGLVWLIHLVEWYLSNDAGAASTVQRALLSTVQDQATFPLLTSKGTIDMVERQLIVAGTPATAQDHYTNPSRHSFLPPVPIASPGLSLYGETDIDSTYLRGDQIQCRIGFTTEELDAAMYTEIAETWGW